MSSRRWLAVAAGAVAVLVVAILVGFGGGDHGRAIPVVVCIDSTTSTDDVRDSYGPDLETVLDKAADDEGRFYAAACGANATGRVNWPIHRRFDSGGYSTELGDEVIDGQRLKVRGELDDLLKATSTKEGTPLGEMLAVAARQCEHAGGECKIYVFTDGEWADGSLRVHDGVTKPEETNYVKSYDDELGNLSGTVVNFVGVGYGTVMGEKRLAEARQVAAAMVAAAGGEMGTWTVRL